VVETPGGGGYGAPPEGASRAAATSRDAPPASV
jgi:N-methylhydantoinase B/oxoprolinase/acetone carboxylase alpha subunit